MKVIELKIDDTKDQGVTAISLVQAPAIEQKFIKFNKEEQYSFTEIDEEKRILAGAFMIPDKQIYRNDGEEEYFVFFKEATIRQLAQKFFLDGKINSTTLEHTDTLNGVTVIESWIVEDSEKDKSAVYGFNLPVGSWFGLMKVDNTEVWERVKSEGLQGFSIEGVFISELIKNSEQMDIEKIETSIIEKVKSMFGLEEPKPVEQEAVFGEVAVTAKADGSEIVILFEGDSLEPGASIFYLVDEEQLPVPTGEYTMEDGKRLIVAEEGILGEILEAEEPEEVEEEEPAEMTADDIANAVAKALNEVLGQFKTEVNAEFSEKVELLREEFNKPAEAPANVVPEEKPEPKRIKTPDEIRAEFRKK